MYRKKRVIVKLYEVEMRSTARRHQSEILATVAALGGDHRRYRRVRAQAARAIISELYSPPRVGALGGRLPRDTDAHQVQHFI